MPLQNRVTPQGDIVATLSRGTLMGNRGCLHDASRRLVRRHAGGYRAWVTCLLAFKGRRRTPMTPGRYTELFFLDEATALAAGHRPCGECRRADYRRFKAAWLTGNSKLGLDLDAPIAVLDRVLHRDRLTPDGTQRTFVADLDELPDGVFVTQPDLPTPHLVWRGMLWPWSLTGYTPPVLRPDHGPATVLTPHSTVNALGAGYSPMVHESAPSSKHLQKARNDPLGQGRE
ncbi:MAG: hypothetical protein ACREKS_14435 [Candidatus Rokuibacteriota bacterium]